MPPVLIFGPLLRAPSSELRVQITTPVSELNILIIFMNRWIVQGIPLQLTTWSTTNEVSNDSRCR